MKYWYCLVMSLIMAAGCSGSAQDEAVLDIKVNAPVAGEVVVVHHNDMIPLILDSEGYAQLRLADIDASYLKVYHGREFLKLYVEGGDNASLSFEGGRMGRTYVFEGEKAPVVKYLNTVALVPLPDEDFALGFEEYSAKLAEKENDAVKILKANGFSRIGDFEKMELGRIRYSYGAALLMYPTGHMLMSRDMSYRPDEAYYGLIDGYVVEDEMMASLDEYRSFVAEAMHVLDAANRQVREIYPKTVAQMKYAADRFQNDAVREVVLHHIATTYVDNFGVKDITEMENLYYTYVKDAAMLESMKAKYDRWDLSRPGRMSPGFRAVDVDGKEYTLADFRGKYVYIDMWATWCAPCKREMPYLKALEEEFADAQVVFLGLSVDKDKQAWENMVRAGGLTGVQLYLGLQSKFQEAYRIEGIPRFILLDQEGRIIENDMSRPSEEVTAEKLRNLKDIR
ncbi:MAG: TlpA family protein disulfide reductase [Bacteroidales bacterium]|nr:TlpA family protein disulfide reductase [Bacteroidales bacterium]MBR5862067.1 TlpA family protein disulfide reductase [Bacteroidales bacterium]